MDKKKLHPSVERFKKFVKRHPKLVAEVRKGNTTWQDLYEEWYILGENDPKWNRYKKTAHVVEEKNEEKKNHDHFSKYDVLNQIIQYVKKIDLNQLQQYLGKVNEAIESLQNFLNEMNGTNAEYRENVQHQSERRPGHPFSFRKD